MKTYKAHEFKDLTPKIQEQVREKFINELTELNIIRLTNDLDAGRITETEYYNELGCSKDYAERTAWFVPACYYEKHKKAVDKEVKDLLAKSLFTETGHFIA